MKANSQHGFTLIELMMVLAILAIMLTFAVSGFGTIFANNRQVSLVNQFITSLHLARSEAIKRGGRVALCKSSNASATPPNCAAAGIDWDAGWVVWVDSDSDSVIDATETVLQAVESLSGNVTFQSPEAVVVYLSSGSTVDFVATTSNGTTFTLCDGRGATYAKAVTIRNSGRPASSGGVDVDGVALTC